MFKGIAFVLCGACSFGILSTFVKLAYSEGFTLGDVTGTQVFFGLIILWVMVLLRRLITGRGNSASLKEALQLIAMGTSTGLVSVFYYKCVQTVPASIAILLLMQFTWMSLFLDALVKRKLPTLLQIGTVLLVLLGTAFAGNLFGSTYQDISLEGIGFGLLAALFYTIFLMVSGAAGNNLHPATKSALLLTGACILVFSIFPPVFLVNGSLFNGLFKWGLILSVFGTVLPPLLYAYGIPRVGLGLSAILSSAELPVAVMMSSLVLQEQVVAVQWCGVALILVAIALSNIGSLRRLRKQQNLAQA